MNHFPLSRTHSTNEDVTTTVIAPGLCSYDYDQTSNFENRHPHHTSLPAYHETYLDEDLPVYTPPTNSHPRRRRTVPGGSSNLNLAPGMESPPPGIGGSGHANLNNGPGNGYGNHNSTNSASSASTSHYQSQVSSSTVSASHLNQKAMAYIPNAFRNR
jgi:hypothetical protein